MNKALLSVIAASLILASGNDVNANPTNNTAKAKQSKGLSTAVKWTQQSQEFTLLTHYLYRQATQALREKTLPTTPWLVIMDVDETLLNNSDYNKRLDLSNGNYTNESWRSWVHEENASAIPGAIEFVNTVFELGGQLALVTNRNQQDDAYTWRNLTNVGFGINSTNTCLVGKRAQDKAAIDNKQIINDKDLRRNAFVSGNASLCWTHKSSVKQRWNQPFTLVFQVGDNIEDIAKTTQKNTDMNSLLKRQGKDILILPNAMYGSWSH